MVYKMAVTITTTAVSRRNRYSAKSIKRGAVPQYLEVITTE